ncbi:MAG: hypothetical protein IIZ59_02105 [Clostridia bacterium]|nr:hypothetical protein [Clostridia bacterium]
MKKIIAAALASTFLMASGADMPPDITQPVNEETPGSVTGHDNAIRMFANYNTWIEPSDFKEDVNLVYTGCSVHSSLGVDIYAMGLLYEKTDDGVVITAPYVPISKNKDVCSEGLNKLYAAEKTGEYAAEYLADFYSTCDEVSIYIPTTVDGVPVTGIASGAFADCDALKAVYIPHTMKELDLSVFNKNAATAVCGLKNSVTGTLSAENIGRVASPFDVTSDGQTDSGDSMNILRLSVGMTVEPDGSYIRALADGNGDGQIDSSDALAALCISVGLENESDYYNNHPYCYNVSSAYK